MTDYALAALPSQIHVGNLEGYIHYANSIPILSREEEQSLTTKLYELNDLKAAQALVLAHLRYVVRVAKGYMGYGLALGDLIQEGTVGLMKAVKKFQPDRGVRLVTFAMHWIKAEIHEFVIRNWRMVKIATTKPQRKLFFKLRSMKKCVGWLSKKGMSAIAQDLNVKVAEVEHTEARLSTNDTPFDLPKGISCEHQEYRALAPIEYLEDHSLNPEAMLEKEVWERHVQQKFNAAFKKLDIRSQAILQQRWLQGEETPKATLEELAQQFAVSKERIRQLEAKAIKFIRSQLIP